MIEFLRMRKYVENWLVWLWLFRYLKNHKKPLAIRPWPYTIWYTNAGKIFEMICPCEWHIRSYRHISWFEILYIWRVKVGGGHKWLFFPNHGSTRFNHLSFMYRVGNWQRFCLICIFQVEPQGVIFHTNSQNWAKNDKNR